jgi:hypothetical protein
VNFGKSEVLPLTNSDAPPQALPFKTVNWGGTVRHLGYTLSTTNFSAANDEHLMLQKLNSTAHACNISSFSYSGRALIINAKIASKLWYWCRLASPSDNFIKNAQRILTKTFWCGGASRIAQDTIMQTKPRGGIGLADVGLRLRAIRLSWISRLAQHAKKPNKSMSILLTFLDCSIPSTLAPSFLNLLISKTPISRKVFLPPFVRNLILDARTAGINIHSKFGELLPILPPEARLELPILYNPLLQMPSDTTTQHIPYNSKVGRLVKKTNKRKLGDVYFFDDVWFDDFALLSFPSSQTSLWDLSPRRTKRLKTLGRVLQSNAVTLHPSIFAPQTSPLPPLAVRPTSLWSIISLGPGLAQKSTTKSRFCAMHEAKPSPPKPPILCHRLFPTSQMTLDPDVWSYCRFRAIPSRARRWLWLTLHGRILQRRTINIISKHDSNTPTTCPFCPTKEDSHIHLFLQCPTTQAVWDEVRWLLHHSVATDLLAMFQLEHLAWGFVHPQRPTAIHKKHHRALLFLAAITIGTILDHRTAHMQHKADLLSTATLARKAVYRILYALQACASAIHKFEDFKCLIDILKPPLFPILPSSSLTRRQFLDPYEMFDHEPP